MRRARLEVIKMISDIIFKKIKVREEDKKSFETIKKWIDEMSVIISIDWIKDANHMRLPSRFTNKPIDN